MAVGKTLFRQILQREIFGRFLGSAAGVLWAFVLPILLLAVYSFVFGVILQPRVAEGIPLPFFAWLALAMWPWLAFSESLMRGSQAIIDNGSLLSKVAIPKHIFVISSISAVFILQMIGYIVILLFIALFVGPVKFTGIPVVMLMVITIYIAAIGLGLSLSAIQVYLRDIEHLLPTVLMMWFFLTPIIYSKEILPAKYSNLIELNPMSWVVERIREALIEGSQLAVTDIIFVAVAIVILAIGGILFNRLSQYFEDFL